MGNPARRGLEEGKQSELSFSEEKKIKRQKTWCCSKPVSQKLYTEEAISWKESQMGVLNPVLGL